MTLKLTWLACLAYRFVESKLEGYKTGSAAAQLMPLLDGLLRIARVKE